MFVTLPTPDLAASVDFWTRGLGFFDLFSVPDRITHLRRWAFQDVLLVPGERRAEAAASSVSFSCILGQIDPITAACERLLPGCTTGPRQMPWNSVEVEIVTPENTRVIMTAARPYDPNSTEAEFLRGIGITAPRGTGRDLRRALAAVLVGEARARWGDTAQWAQYAERAAGRTAEHWQRIAETVDALNAELAAALRAGVVPGSERADSPAERHRASMDFFFGCTHSMHVCLGRMYADDPGFAASTTPSSPVSRPGCATSSTPTHVPTASPPNRRYGPDDENVDRWPNGPVGQLDLHAWRHITPRRAAVPGRSRLPPVPSVPRTVPDPRRSRRCCAIRGEPE